MIRPVSFLSSFNPTFGRDTCTKCLVSGVTVHPVRGSSVGCTGESGASTVYWTWMEGLIDLFEEVGVYWDTGSLPSPFLESRLRWDLSDTQCL